MVGTLDLPMDASVEFKDQIFKFINYLWKTILDVSASLFFFTVPQLDNQFDLLNHNLNVLKCRAVHSSQPEIFFPSFM